jgi:translation initiation factor IF-3
MACLCLFYLLEVFPPCCSVMPAGQYTSSGRVARLCTPLAALHTTRPIAHIKSGPRINPSPPIPDREPRDEEIKYEFITLVGPDGKLKEGGPFRVSEVLKTMDRSAYFLVLVNPTTDPPVCRLFSKKELFDQQRRQKEIKKALAAARVVKHIALNDTTQQHDIEHRMRKAKEILSKGQQVNLTITTRQMPSTKAGKAEAAQRRHNMLKSILPELLDYGTVSQKPVDENGTLQVTIQGRPATKTTEAKQETGTS